MKRDPQVSLLVSSIAKFMHGIGFGELRDARPPDRTLAFPGHHRSRGRSVGDTCVVLSVQGWSWAGNRNIHRQRLLAPQAAFMNGPLARLLEFDDMAMRDLRPSGELLS